MDNEMLLGSKTKIRILSTLFKNQNKQYTIRQLSLDADVSYASAYEDIKEFLSLHILKDVDGKVVLDRETEEYEKIRGIFQTGIAVSNRLLSELEPLADMLKQQKSVTIALHHNADPDSLGSGVALAMGLRQFSIAAEVVAPNGISKQSKAVLSKYPFTVKEKSSRPNGVLVVVDASSREQLGELKTDGYELLLVDHHEKGDLFELAKMKVVDTSASSTCILMLKLLQVLDVRMTEEIATFLLGGMMTDTGFLRMAGNEDLLAIQSLLGKRKVQEIMDLVSIEEDISERMAKLKAAKRGDYYKAGNKLIAFSHVGSFEASAALTLVRSGSDAAFVFNVDKGEIRISGRARPSFGHNLADILRNLDPIIDGHAGGHNTAASANGKNGRSEQDAKRMLIKRLEELLGTRLERLV